MSHKRSLNGRENQTRKKKLRKQARTYIQDNSRHDLMNGETAFLDTPYQLASYLKALNGNIELTVVSPSIYGLVVEAEEGTVAHAAQGLVLKSSSLPQHLVFSFQLRVMDGQVKKSKSN